MFEYGNVLLNNPVSFNKNYRILFSVIKGHITWDKTAGSSGITIIIIIIIIIIGLITSQRNRQMHI
jgi:hypothetical protein